MGNSFRCCIACMLPCGALDVVRVLHPDGRVDEYHHKTITASEVMKSNPKHVLAQPTCQKPSILHPNTLLQKGKIYFLIPTYTLHRKTKPKSFDSNPPPKTRPPRPEPQPPPPPPPPPRCGSSRRRTEGRRASVWRPALESISEAPAL